MTFHEELVKESEQIWDVMLQHPFLNETADCRIPDSTFANWLQQDYLFVRGAIPFLSVMISRAPFEIRREMASAVGALHEELKLFEEMASSKDVSLQDILISPVCHAYVQFMLATAHTASFEEGFALLYGAEKAYFDSWSWVKENLKCESPWSPFIEKWSDEHFRQWIAWIERTLEMLADQASSSLRNRMKEIFWLAGQYELLFWDMAYQGAAWPVQRR